MALLIYPYENQCVCSHFFTIWLCILSFFGLSPVQTLLFCFLSMLAKCRSSVMDDSVLREGRFISEKWYLQMQIFLLLLFFFIIDQVKSVRRMKTQQRHYYLYFFFSDSQYPRVILEKNLYVRNTYGAPTITVISALERQRLIGPWSHLSRNSRPVGKTEETEMFANNRGPWK